MPGLFSSVKTRPPRRNKFDLSHERKMSIKMGELVPIMCQEIVPGDKWRVNSEVFIRFAPLLAPIMHRVNVYVHHFFVPMRLVFNGFEDFITGGPNGTTVAPLPSMEFDSQTPALLGKGTLWDYMGLPVGDGVTQPAIGMPINAMPFRAYQLIWSEYFRDQNLTPSIEANVNWSLAGGAIGTAQSDLLLTMRKRAWEKDYFTSALPFAQRGPEVLMPVDGTGSVTYLDRSRIRQEDGGLPTTAQNIQTGPNPDVGDIYLPGDAEFGRIENIDEVTVDNISTTINDLRRSIRLQEWLELAARVGSRYVEVLKGFFGVKPSDARLQRPEFLGGGKTPVKISEVLSTFQQDAEGVPQGNMAGHGVAVGSKNSFSRFFEEHGYVISLMSVLPRTAYQQGVAKMWRRGVDNADRFEFYWKQFANIGEQEIPISELYTDMVNAQDYDQLFGYQSRYAEYKYIPSTVHGEFRDTLSFWHMGRIFSSQPSLNTSFVESDPTTRIFAVEEDTEHLYVYLYNKVDALRPMPYFGTPQF